MPKKTMLELRYSARAWIYSVDRHKQGINHEPTNDIHRAPFFVSCVVYWRNCNWLFAGYCFGVIDITMDKQSGLMVIKIGEEDGISLIEFIRWRESTLLDDREKLLWWASFLGSLGGICAATIGTQALEAIAEINGKTTAKLLAEKMN